MKTLTSLFNRNRVYGSEEAYDLWAKTYDDERDNLMLYYDKIILNKLIAGINLNGKVILDYGCGTGRNWGDLLNHNPQKIIGCDTSSGMLDVLKSKYKNAETHIITENNLSFLPDYSCDVLISTLVIAHIKEIKEIFSEWSRVLKPEGDIIITDFHPEHLSSGGSRTFKHDDKSITIKNYVHPVEFIKKELSLLGFETKELIEIKIDKDVKSFYEKNNALAVYEKYKGQPFIYGIHLSRRHAD